MKTLANCKPSEFLAQTNRIRKAAAKWMQDTGILEIRKNKPELVKFTQDMSEEDRVRVFNENRERSAEAIRQNAMAILDAILDDHPSETLELMALACFIEPEDADNHSVAEYLAAIAEILNDEAVIGFFSSLAALGSVRTASASSR